MGAYTGSGQALIRGALAGAPETRAALAAAIRNTPATRGAVAYQNRDDDDAKEMGKIIQKHHGALGPVQYPADGRP
jgi:hypothetical protein